MANASHSTGRRPGDSRSAWASGGVVFAGVLMLIEGIFGIFNGIAAIAKDDVYASVGDYVFKFSLTSWGWIHLILGILLALTGLGVLKGAGWARGLGVGLTALFVILQFMWLPYTPLWAIISIGVGVFVIWALCTDHGRTSSV
ncbi:hypothetical protein [Streptomyces sp. SCL15-6]|jgi:hypothetical protein|uniref:DUF7144 family membrane protein n=1 Tax=Streptomyces sp. SCL15-6 TaxID=2967222 RepID=UPI0029665F8C|nr:hypothetical protein [Streptomyces sp. SCL15-6]